VSKERAAKKARITSGIKEILEFRGYKIKKTEEDDDYIDLYGFKKNEDGEEISIIARFPKNPQIGVKTIRELSKKQKEHEINEAIIISETALTHYAKKEAIKLGIEVISSSNPLFNIFDHELVPQHIKMTPEEVEEFLEKYKIKKHQIPKILETDPAIKAIQAKPGDIIKIIRNPALGEAGIYYRYVIKSASRLSLSESKPAKTKKKPKVSRKKKEEEELEEEKLSEVGKIDRDLLLE